MCQLFYLPTHRSYRLTVFYKTGAHPSKPFPRVFRKIDSRRADSFNSTPYMQTFL